jgi:hypothetical protein
MKMASFQRSGFKIISILFLLFFLSGFHVVFSQVTNEAHWDIILKIENIDDTLNIIDNLIGADNQQPEKSPTAILRAMLQGTDWIDPRRLVVIALQLQETQPSAVVLIPFNKPNELFKSMFNAASGPNYYLVPLPPGRDINFSTAAETILSAESNKIAGKSISCEFAVDQLLKKSDAQIRNMLMDMQNIQPGDHESGQSISSGNIQEMVNNLMGVAAQLETFSIGFNLSPEIITASMEIQARDKTLIGNLFSPNTQKTILNRYTPTYQMNYKMARFDMTGMLNLMDQLFGKMYQEMGVDFKELTSIADHFTGETAGGMNYDITGSGFEAVTVLKTTQNSPNFFETIFFPWLKNYNDTIRKMLEPEWGDKIGPIYHRTQDSMVSGHRVVGVNIQFPLLPPARGQLAGSAQDMNTMSYEMRMTVAENLLLIAPDDSRIAELLRMAKKLTQEPLTGPMARFEIDITSYFNMLKNIIPELSASGPVPDMGKISYTADMKNGRFSANSAFKVQDIRNMIHYLKSLSETSSGVSFEGK